MKSRAQIRMLADGRRVHMHDGPIDLIVEAFGAPAEVQCAYRAGAERFVTVLDELCGELRFLRQAVPHFENREMWGTRPHGAVARRMFEAVLPFAATHFITPMAAVAGAVAEDILLAMTSVSDLRRAYVNDGGDIALHLSPGEKFVVGMMEYPGSAEPTFRKARIACPEPAVASRRAGHPLLGSTTITYEDPVRGIATSGWRGRSFSLGIADAVTVLADTAAMADAAATMIANAVDLPGHPEITRARACDLAPDSDLGERLVTQGVGELSRLEIQGALATGMEVAESLQKLGLIRAAALRLKEEVCVSETSTITAGYRGLRRGSVVHA